MSPSSSCVEFDEERICPLCGGTTFENLFFNGAADPITLERFHILSCSSCETVFTWPVPNDLEPYYPKHYRAYSSWVQRILQWFYSRRVDRWAKLSDAPGRVLEVGCGAGIMLEIFRNKRWLSKGLERTETIAAHARESRGLDVTSQNVEDLCLEPTFDLIVLFNVLEHLINPVGVLQDCIRRLKPGGRLIINVPNFRSWQARFAGPAWLHLDPPRHLFHFTPESLAKILERLGLVVEKTNYVSLEHDPYGWVESIINRILREQNALTLYLMDLKPFGSRVALSLVLAILLTGPALLLSLLSWITGNGALFETIAALPLSSKKGIETG